MPAKTTHPRVPGDVGAFFLTLALGIRQVMLTRHGDGRDLGMGEAMRLYLVHVGEFPLPDAPESLRRLDALREVLASARRESSSGTPQEGSAHG